MPALTKIPAWLQVYNKDICWKVEGETNAVYLTFDDGPHPVATPEILNILADHGIKATFFCVGKNVETHPEIFKRILMEGHVVGNHSYSHKSGWKMNTDEYVKDVMMASGHISSTLFRPPYGRITPSQFKSLKRDYKIIMWDVLSKDYDTGLPDEEVIGNVIHNVSPGSVIVMHDNEKTVNRIGTVLNQIIDRLKKKNLQFKTF